MAIAGWIIWGVVCLLSLVFLFTSVEGLLKRHPWLVTVPNFAVFALLGILLWLTLWYDIPKVHLAWAAPTCFVMVILGSRFLARFEVTRLLRRWREHRDDLLRRRGESICIGKGWASGDWRDLIREGGRKKMAFYRVETSAFGRFFFVIACAAVTLGIVTFLSIVGDSFLDAFVFGGVWCLLGGASWFIGFWHDSRKVRRGELKWDRPESEGGLAETDQDFPDNGPATPPL